MDNFGVIFVNILSFLVCIQTVCEEFLEIYVIVEFKFTLKVVRDMIRIYSQMYHTDKYSHHSSINWPVWLNAWVFAYELSACVLKSRFIILIFRFCDCFGQEGFWNSPNIDCEFSLKCIPVMIRTCSKMLRTGKYSQHNSISWLVGENGWLYIYELSEFQSKSRCSHLIFTFCLCFEEVILRHSVNYIVYIHCKTSNLHDKNIQSNKLYE